MAVSTRFHAAVPFTIAFTKISRAETLHTSPRECRDRSGRPIFWQARQTGHLERSCEGVYRNAAFGRLHFPRQRIIWIGIVKRGIFIGHGSEGF